MGLFFCRRCAAETAHEVETPAAMKTWDREDTILVCSECRSPAGFTERISIEAGQTTRERVWTLDRAARLAGRGKLIERLKLIDQNIAATLPAPGDVSYRDAMVQRIAAGKR